MTDPTKLDNPTALELIFRLRAEAEKANEMFRTFGNDKQRFLATMLNAIADEWQEEVDNA